MKRLLIVVRWSTKGQPRCSNRVSPRAFSVPLGPQEAALGRVASFLTLAFCCRTLADARAALWALLRRCSAVMVFMRAFPPRLPNSDRYVERMDFLIFTTE
jgi:hypothetical protein